MTYWKAAVKSSGNLHIAKWKKRKKERNWQNWLYFKETDWNQQLRNRIMRKILLNVWNNVRAKEERNRQKWRKMVHALGHCDSNCNNHSWEATESKSKTTEQTRQSASLRTENCWKGKPIHYNHKILGKNKGRGQPVGAVNPSSEKQKNVKGLTAEAIMMVNTESESTSPSG